MRTFYNEPNQQVKSYNDKIMPNLVEYYYLDGIESMGKIKAIIYQEIKKFIVEFIQERHLEINIFLLKLKTDKIHIIIKVLVLSYL